MLTLSLAIVVGFLIGPWLGIVVDRIYDREQLAPVHRCQICRAPVAGASLIPVWSWTSRCSLTPSHNRWRYPTVDIGTAASFGLLGYHFGDSWQLVPFMVAFAILVVAAVFDAETHLLLDILTFPLMALVAFGVLVLSTPNDWSGGISSALAGGATAGLLLFVPHLIYPQGMGFGDVKLAPTLGMLVGWTTVSTRDAVVLAFYSTLLGLIIGGVIGLVLQKVRSGALIGQPPQWLHSNDLEEDEHELFVRELPFGPFLIVGALVAILASSLILSPA